MKRAWIQLTVWVKLKPIAIILTSVVDGCFDYMKLFCFCRFPYAVRLNLAFRWNLEMKKLTYRLLNKLSRKAKPGKCGPRNLLKGQVTLLS